MEGTARSANRRPEEAPITLNNTGRHTLRLVFPPKVYGQTV